MAGSVPFARSSVYQPNGTLAGLILRQGEQSAQNWQNVGNTIAGSLRDIATQVREAPIRKQEAEARDLGLTQARGAVAAQQRQVSDQAALDTAMGSGLDIDAIEASLPGHLKLQVRKSWNDAETAAATLRSARTKASEAEADYMGTLAAGVQPFLSGEDGGIGAARVALQHAKAAGFDDADQLLQHLESNPQQLPTIVDSLIAKSPTQQKIRGEAADRALKTQQEQRAIEAAKAAAADRERDDRRAEATLAETIRHNKEQAGIERTKAGQTALGSSFWAKDPTTGAVRRMTEQEARAVGAQQPDTADMRNKEASKKTAARAVDAVRALGSKILTKVGPAQRADAIKRGVEAVFGSDPEFRTYQDSRMALAGTLAVEQQGSRVSDADVKALWLPMVPDAYRDTKESNELKWELIDLMRGKEPKAGGGGTVKMRAPNGQMQDVAADQVDHYRSLGATVVK